MNVERSCAIAALVAAFDDERVGVG